MKIKIKTHNVIHNHAVAMCKLLRQLGHDAEVIEEVKPDDETLHLIYVGFASAIPKNYILYQTEVYGNHWWDENYRNICRGALQIWDYSESNLDQYDFGNDKFLIPPFKFDVGPLPEKNINYLFYGYINDRRKAKLAQINVPSIRIVNDIYREEMLEILKRTKTVINIHAYDNSPIELFRITEALSCGCEVMTEDVTGLVPYQHEHEPLISVITDALENIELK